jgi:peroxiredoxin
VYLQPTRSRPVRKVTLSNSIRAFCKNHKKNITPEEILHGLVARGVVVIDDNGRVIYPETAPAQPTATVAPDLNGTPLG